MSTYDYALTEEAVRFFARLRPRQRNRLLVALAQMARNPSLPGDYRERGISGRPYEVRLVDE